MKKILFALLLFSFVATAQKKTDPYLLRVPLLNSLAIDSAEVYEPRYYNECSDWDEQVHKVLNVTLGCAVLGDTDLIIREDIAAGVRQYECNGQTNWKVLFVPKFVEVIITDYCTGVVVGRAAKNLFTLGDGNIFPYCYNRSPLESCLNPPEEEAWLVQYSVNDPKKCNPILDGIQHFNLPDTNLAFTPYREDLDVFGNVIYVSRDRLDYYSNTFNIDGVGDGLYNIEFRLNFPPLPNVQSAGIYSQPFKFPARFQGKVVTPYPIMVPDVPPSTPTNCIASKNVISWTGQAQYFTVQRYVTNGAGKGFQAQGAPVMIIGNSYTDNNIVRNGWYAYGITAHNCNLKSIEQMSNVVQINIKKL